MKKTKKLCVVSDSQDENSLVLLMEELELGYEIMDWKRFLGTVNSDYAGYVIISPDYPEFRTPSKAEYDKIVSIVDDEIPIFCEFLPLRGLIEPVLAEMPFSRLVVVENDGKYFKSMEPMTLLEIHQVPVLELAHGALFGNENLLVEYVVLARVAGTHRAVYGLPSIYQMGKTKVRVVIGRKDTLLFSTVRVSAFHEMEFRPKYLWIKLLLEILEFVLQGNAQAVELITKAIECPRDLVAKLGMVHLSYPLGARRGSLLETRKIMDGLKHPSTILSDYLEITRRKKINDPGDASFSLDSERREKYLTSIKRALDWFRASGMINDDGKMGTCEGFPSKFNPDGTKDMNETQRADCNTDAAFAFFLAGFLPGGDVSGGPWRGSGVKTAKNIFKVVRDVFQFRDTSIRRGLFAWTFHPYAYNVFYSDDNGRCIYEHILAGIAGIAGIAGFSRQAGSHVSKEESMNLLKRGLMGVIALKNTWGKTGHRWGRIDLKDMYKIGGRAGLRNHKTKQGKYRSPHYESNSQAAAILGAGLVGDHELLKLVAIGIDDYMKKLKKVPVEHSFNDDFSKFLLAVAFLVKASNKNHDAFTKEERERYTRYMREIVAIFGSIQDACGAVPERDLSGGKKHSETSNKKYGTSEVSVYTTNTDMITDQLYSTGFLAVALYFAWKTGACDEAWPILVKLLDFLCAIQYRSTTSNPQLDGCWMRGFDYGIEEYYGANGDIGWGAYSVESGWMVAVIASALELVLIDFDPWNELPGEFMDEITRFYQEEVKVQLDNERDWQANTPRAFTSSAQADEHVKAALGQWTWDPSRDWSQWGPDYTGANKGTSENSGTGENERE
ncbi:MAG: hypothetical protein ACTSUE_13830 [Promethearchaeota archaeon]